MSMRCHYDRIPDPVGTKTGDFQIRLTVNLEGAQ